MTFIKYCYLLIITLCITLVITSCISTTDTGPAGGMNIVDARILSMLKDHGYNAPTYTYVGTNDTIREKCYVFSDTDWVLAGSDTNFTDGVLGIALSTNSSLGMLLLGHYVTTNYIEGSNLYLDPLDHGSLTATPNSSNVNVRYLGTMMDSNTVFFNPSVITPSGNNDEIDKLWAELLYVEPSVSFSSPNRTLEIGSSYSGGNLSFTVNKTMVERSITGSHNNDYGSGGAINDIPIGSITEDYNATITVTDSRTNTANDNISFVFRNRTYYGTSSKELHEITNGDILDLIGIKFATRGNSGNANPTGLEYVYVAYPAVLGSCSSFTMNGLGSSAWPKLTRSVTNSSGYVETYRIYRSEQKQASGLSYDIH